MIYITVYAGYFDDSFNNLSKRGSREAKWIFLSLHTQFQPKVQALVLESF